MENEKRVKIRKRESLIITSLFAIFALDACVGCVSAATYIVCPSGCDYTSIQAAITVTDPSDTIEVHSGIYYELVNVKKQLTLRGVDTGGGKPVVDARRRGSAITLTADGITLEGFAVTNGTGMGMMEFLWTAGIRITSNNNIITNNTVSNSSRGITLCSWDPGNNYIKGNTISNNKEGIGLWHSSSNNTFTGNSLSNNIWYGIYLYNSSNNSIIGNTVCNNGEGFWFYSSNNNKITGNIVCNNGDGICLYYSSSNNKIFLNNFINNTANAFSFHDATNIWNSTDEITYTCKYSTHTNYLGNYWSDYKEKYPNAKEIYGCGIWDTPYSISFDHDFHPLIQPWENYFAPAASIFDTGTGTYPSIKGTHEGTIKPSSSINVSKLYTYPCARTGGHTESIKLEENGTVIANGTWDGYHEDWHNITLYNVTDGTHYVTLLQDHEYNYTIRTGSYPQILHAASKEVTGGTITCTSFVDANGKRYSKMIPAIRLE